MGPQNNTADEPRASSSLKRALNHNSSASSKSSLPSRPLFHYPFTTLQYLYQPTHSETSIQPIEARTYHACEYQHYKNVSPNDYQFPINRLALRRIMFFYVLSRLYWHKTGPTKAWQNSFSNLFSLDPTCHTLTETLYSWKLYSTDFSTPFSFGIPAFGSGLVPFITLHFLNRPPTGKYVVKWLRTILAFLALNRSAWFWFLCPTFSEGVLVPLFSWHFIAPSSIHLSY